MLVLVRSTPELPKHRKVLSVQFLHLRRPAPCAACRALRVSLWLQDLLSSFQIDRMAQQAPSQACLDQHCC